MRNALDVWQWCSEAAHAATVVAMAHDAWAQAPDGRAPQRCLLLMAPD